MSRREQIGGLLAALFLAAGGAVAGVSQKNFTWTGTPMRVAYTFGFLAVFSLVVAFGRRAWIRVVWATTLGWGWDRVSPYLPRITAPERRPRLRRRRRYDTDYAKSLVSAGRMGERLSQEFDIGEPEITSNSVRYRLRSKSQEGTNSALAKAAVSPAAQPPSELAAAAVAGEQTPSQQVFEASHRERERVLARSLRQEGERLNSELWEHADAARHQPVGGLPKVYLGQVEDWYARFRGLAKRQLEPQDRVRNTKPYPPWQKLVGFFAGAGATEKLVEELDQMFKADIAVLNRIEKALSRG